MVVAEAVLRRRSGLGSDRRPTGSFLLARKVELVKADDRLIPARQRMPSVPT